jgi:hypothetical protein
LLAQQVRVERMARPDMLVEWVGVLYLNCAPPDRPNGAGGRAQFAAPSPAADRPAGDLLIKAFD